MAKAIAESHAYTLNLDCIRNLAPRNLAPLTQYPDELTNSIALRVARLPFCF